MSYMILAAQIEGFIYPVIVLLLVDYSCDIKMIEVSNEEK